MKLYYCKYPEGRQNFGDALNPWLWEQLLPGILDDDPDCAFVGIGTLINDALPRRTPKAKLRVIFSTGAGYEKAMPVIDESYKIYCVRGPISAQTLGLNSDLAVTDGALLLRKVIEQNPLPKKYKFSYMPHYNFAGDGWQRVCDQLGFGYISPAWEIEDILIRIRQTEVLICEAMHGAIVADTLRTPWIAVTTHPSILPTKWQDWCASMTLEYQPYSLSYYYQPRASKGGWANSQTSANKLDHLLTPARKLQDWFRQQKAARELSNLVKIAQPCLSSDNRMEEMLSRLEGCLEQFKLDFAQGKFKV
ncbi:polysaccharide pyruvyl transferase family protein [Anabaena azotica]|uniref:Polysaccharide pyruvyl transferase family protein n=1 Tax=Anabaena azotica FACHB-119 TaxID=947527 RepID=A0ABR8CWM0_9NOST|nr:polysaccharide pyruvyl transferase family protein [Anabaena azotica]MBD2499329.1 polysaccharide pyruvyl transferase family protein [Anabaena azotica FACHB-119]